jgi:hypothetical protein
MEGINDYQEQKNGEGAIIQALNRRLPHGPLELSEAIILPNEPSSARAMVQHCNPLPTICVQQSINDTVLNATHVDKNHSLYRFCQEDGWYTATADSVENLLAA